MGNGLTAGIMVFLPLLLFQIPKLYGYLHDDLFSLFGLNDDEAPRLAAIKIVTRCRLKINANSKQAVIDDP